MVRLVRNVLPAVLWMGMAFSTPADDTPATTGAGEAELTGLAESWARAVGGNQPEELAAILDERYEHIHGTGLLESRSQFLEALRTGSRKYQPIHLEEVRVKVCRGFALVTGKFALRVEVKGKTLEGVNRFCLTLLQRPEGWRILQFQATAIPPKN